MTQRMSTTDESRILGALEDVADLINDGQTPNDAIVKIASERQMPKGHVELMVQAYNTGRTTKQREVGEDPLEKSADFDLANPAAIVEALYPSRVKSAAAIRRETEVSPDYSMPPEGWYNPAKRTQSLEKVAHTIDWRMAKDKDIDPLPRDPHYAVKRAYESARTRERRIAEARANCVDAQGQLTDHLEKIAEYFRRPGCEPFGEVADNVAIKFGGEGVAVMNHVFNHMPTMLQKQASYIPDEPTHAVSYVREPYKTIKAAIRSIDQVRVDADEFEKLSAEHEQLTREQLSPFVEAAPTPQPTILDGIVESAPSSGSTATETERGGLGGLLTKMAIGQPKVVDKVLGVKLLTDIYNNVGQGLHKDKGQRDEMVDKALQQISTPEHEQQLRDIRTQSMLQDMLSNDDVISSYDPHDVLGAFNEISHFTPRIASQPLYMQALMRKRLTQGNMDTFEYDNLTGTEKNLKEIQSPTRPGIGIRPPSNNGPLPTPLS